MGNLTEIRSMQQLSTLVRDGFDNWDELGDVYAVEYDGLILFNYKSSAVYADRWNYFETVSRGLILNRATGDVVARPFDKFWNWGERGRTTDAPLLRVWEKIDGSLGILYRHKGEWRVATRGSFDGPQAVWATEFFNQTYPRPNVPSSLTMLFEIVYPENRIVVDYGERRDLFLLAVRNIQTGMYIPPQAWGGMKPPKMPTARYAGIFSGLRSVAEIEDATRSLPANEEGYVAEFADGSRFKFKGDAYLRVARLVSAMSKRGVLRAMIEDRDIDTSDMPPHIRDDVIKWRTEIEIGVGEVRRQVNETFARAPKSSRKEFALWVKENAARIAPLLFLRMDSGDIGGAIMANYDRYTAGSEDAIS